MSLNSDGARHRVALDKRTGCRAVTVGSQTEVVEDFIAARVADDEALLFGCDGLHGVRRAIVAAQVSTRDRRYPFAWLGILADQCLARVCNAQRLRACDGG